MKDKELGVVTINYNKEGIIVTGDLKVSPFVPDKELVSKLAQIPGVEPEVINKQAQLIFSAWFAMITGFELADMFEYEIASEVVHCEKHENGKVKQCQLKFIFRKRIEQVNNVY